MEKGLGKGTLALIRLILIPILLTPLAYALYERWLDVRVILQATNWGSVLLGLLVLILIQPLMGLISWLVLYYLDQHFSYLRISSIYFVSQAAKYLPGGIWAFPGRIMGYQAIGVKGSVSMISMVREVSVLFAGAALVGLFGLFRGLIIANWVRLAIMGGGTISLLAIALIQIPGFWRVLSKVPLLKNVEMGDAEMQKARLRLNWLPGALLVSVVFWLLTGVAFYAVATGISRNVVGISWFEASSIFSIAWCAGFVIVLAPAGLGVRESVLSGLLSSYMPLSEALSIALVARLWWTMAEAIFIVVAIMNLARTRNPATEIQGKDISSPR